MSVPAVHQFLPTAEPGAVGAHTREVQRLLTGRLGVRSEIFAEHIHPPFEGVARAYGDYGRTVAATPSDVLIYQMAVGARMADTLPDLPGRLVVNHHNLTPSRFLRPWDPTAAAAVELGARQLAALAPATELGIAVSGFNELDLVATGYRTTAVAPVLVDLEAFDQPTDADVERRTEATRSSQGATWLFVGRLVPNKAHHHLIRALAVYRRLYDPHARLWLVGSRSPTSSYEAALRAYIVALELTDAVDITGPVSPVELAARYRHADVFVCLSEHEGYCVPVLEAMWHRLPIVTLTSSAIPETVVDAAIVLPTGPGPQPQAATVAAAVERAVHDEALRAALVIAGTRRVAERSLERTRDRMAEVLGPLLRPRCSGGDTHLQG
ncbi:MAG: glycosyltransferase family 4 protein [Actinomycetota bacterium]|nr:glycosyltransferase family 4 protein [Actinomycetota bacterium]